jgi:hypothetical protein
MIEAKNGQLKAVSDGEYVSANMARENGKTRVASPPGRGRGFRSSKAPCKI